MQNAQWQQLVRMDRAETARRASCTYLEDCDSFAVTLLNQQYRADMASGRVWRLAPGCGPTPAGFLEQVCILTYLLNVRDIPLANELVRAERLDPGGFFFRGSHELPTEGLEDLLGRAPERLRSVGEILNAPLRVFGDASIEILVLPRIPVTLVIWGADEEFPARASVLFDRSASEQMPLDALYAVAKLTIDTVVKLLQKTS